MVDLVPMTDELLVEIRDTIYKNLQNFDVQYVEVDMLMSEIEYWRSFGPWRPAYDRLQNAWDTCEGKLAALRERHDALLEAGADGKPEFWPRNPYPASVFSMPEERYAEIVPDPDLRTALSGMLGRMFWENASNDIWEALVEAADAAK